MKNNIPPSSLAKDLLIGFCLGTANIIPGVSGGTFLLVFNIYSRVFAVLNSINKDLILSLVTLLFGLVKNRGGKGSMKKLVSFLKESDLLFLLKLILGAVIAIIALSSLMKYLLIHHFAYTYSLFFGLILVSIIIPVRMVKSMNVIGVICVLAGVITTVFVSWSVNPYDKVKIKSDHLEQRYQIVYPKADSASAGTLEKGVDSAGKKPGRSVFTGKYTIEEYLTAGICGAVSISAMVLPGISGSLVLILMGAYFDVISAISALKTGNLDTILFLCCFGGGIVVGGLIFARLISFVLDRYYNGTMGFLIGLMAGSLHALWPFKKVMVMAQQYVKQDGVIIIIENAQIYTNINILPNTHQFLTSLAFFIAGCAVMMVFIRVES